MKRYADLHLFPPIYDYEQTEKLIRTSSELGYHTVGISIPLGVQQDKLLQLQRICNNADVDFIPRIDLLPKTPNELLNKLRRYREKFEIVSVTCLSKLVARQAAKDRRVDVLSFPIINRKRMFFDSAEGELASKASAFLEIDMCPILVSKGFQRIRLLSSLRKMVAIAGRYHVPIVISSGATNSYFIKQPSDCASLAFLFGMDRLKALNSLSEYPLALIKRNKEKLDSDYVIKGVRIVRRSEDV